MAQCREIITYVKHLKHFSTCWVFKKIQLVLIVCTANILATVKWIPEMWLEKILNISSFVVKEITKFRIVFDWSIRILTDDIITPNIIQIKANQYAQLARKKFFTHSNILAGLTRLIIAEVLKFHINSSYYMRHIQYVSYFYVIYVRVSLYINAGFCNIMEAKHSIPSVSPQSASTKTLMW
jgi:hypothetical protein